MLEFNPSLHIKNKQGLTPLNLAARLARAEMFYYILNKLRQVWFTYGDISTGSYPLDTIDTIAGDGSIDTTCSIYLVINGVRQTSGYIIKYLLYCLFFRQQKVIWT